MNGLDAFVGSAPGASPIPPQNGLDAFLSAQAPTAAATKTPTTELPGVSPAKALLDPQFYRDIASNTVDLAKSFVHHAMNLPHGGAQLIEHGIKSAADVLPSNPVSSYIDRTVASDDAALAAREKNYQKNVPDSPGAYVGAAAGEIAPFLFGGELQKGMELLGKAGAKPFTALAARSPEMLKTPLNVAGKVAGGTVQGGVIGSSLPVTSDSLPYDEQKKNQVLISSLVGGATPLVTGAVRSTVNAARGLAAPFLDTNGVVGPAANRLVSGNPDATEQLSKAVEYVPGSRPTAAQVAPSPEMVQAEKTLSNDPKLKPLFVQREIDNNAARIKSLQEIAGDSGALEAAKVERSRVAKNLYGWAFEHPEEVTPWMKGQVKNLTKRPAMLDAMKEAQILAKNEGLKLTDNNSVQGLHYAKMALNDQIDTAMLTGKNNAERVLIGIRDKLLTFMDKLSPTYAQARSEFAQASAPINTMEVANELLDKVNTGSFDASGMPKIDYRGYKAALRKATGNSDYPIDPKAQTVLENIQKDLQRSTISGSLRTPGSDTAFNLKAPGWAARHVFGANYEGPTTPFRIAGMMAGAALAPGHTLAGLATGGGLGYAGAAKLGSMAGSRVNAAMADAMLNPSKFAALISKSDLPPTMKQKLLSALVERAPQVASYEYARHPAVIP